MKLFSLSESKYMAPAQEQIAGKWFKTTATSDYQVFQRKTIDVGGP